MTTPVEPLALTGEVDTSPWFSKLVDEISSDVSTKPELHEDALADARHWARLVVGPSADPEGMERLARRHAVAELVNRRTWTRAADCAATPIEGEGLELLNSRGNGVVVAFLHSGIWLASIGLLRQIDRPLYVPMDKDLEEKVPRWEQLPRWGSSLLALRLAIGDLGVRFVGPDRGLGVMRRLLKEGEACAVPADLVGSGEGMLLGREVRTNRAPMTLSMLAGVPLVLAGSFWDDTGFKVRTSRPFEPQQYKTVRAMHAAVLKLMDEWLSERPEQLLTRFPAAELGDLLDRVEELTPVLARLRATEIEAKSRRREANRAVRRLAKTRAAKEGSSPDRGIPQARKDAESAAQAFEQAQRERKALARMRRELKDEIAGPSRAMSGKE